jgi:poly(A) polymerase
MQNAPGARVSYLTIKAMPISTTSVLASRVLAVLHGAGHTAYLVGGCVRDLLMDRPAKDFDVATSARPDELLRLFPGSDMVGAHFGVVLVKGGVAGEAVEVATFRSDHAYHDGRHPEGVTFETDPRKDALRRDFTINAMMMDPRSGAVLDFAGGRADIAARLIRTVGDAIERFGEDHLRLMRAVRFAARLGFEIEAGTFDAIRALAPRLRAVSAERVREELVRILTEGGARRGLELLAATGLWTEIAPELVVDRQMLAMLDGSATTLTLALSAVFFRAARPQAILARLRFSNSVTERVEAVIGGQARFAAVESMTVSELKRFLRAPEFEEQLELHRLHCLASGAPLTGYEFAQRRRSAYSPGDLFPPRLLTGDDLIALGLAEGPAIGRLLHELETGQLEGRLTTRAEALEFVVKAAC